MGEALAQRVDDLRRATERLEIQQRMMMRRIARPMARLRHVAGLPPKEVSDVVREKLDLAVDDDHVKDS